MRNAVSLHDAVPGAVLTRQFCWQIRIGTIRGLAPERISAYTGFFFERYLHQQVQRHIAAAAGAVVDGRLRMQMISEIRELESLSAVCCEKREFNRLCGQIERLLSFEEQQLVPALEDSLSRGAFCLFVEEEKRFVQKMRAEVADWDDKFWAVS